MSSITLQDFPLLSREEFDFLRSLLDYEEYEEHMGLHNGFSDEEVPYMKDRSRENRLWRNRRAKRHAEEVKDILDKKDRRAYKEGPKRKDSDEETQQIASEEEAQQMASDEKPKYRVSDEKPKYRASKRERVILEVFERYLNILDILDDDTQFDVDVEAFEPVYEAKILTRNARPAKSFSAKQKQTDKRCKYLKEEDEDSDEDAADKNSVCKKEDEASDGESDSTNGMEHHTPYFNRTAEIATRVNPRLAKKACKANLSSASVILDSRYLPNVMSFSFRGSYIGIY